MLVRGSVALVVATGSALVLAATVCAPAAFAVPGPEVEYVYDVYIRRHFNFPDNDAIGYGRRICDLVSGGAPYGAVMAEVKATVTPNDEQSANYLVSNAVGILCPSQIWQLRNTAAGYQPAP